METDAIRMNLFFVSLEGVNVLGVKDEAEIPEVHVETLA